jgi:DNA polymerase III alpha subunit
MSWYEQFRGEAGRQAQRQVGRSGCTEVSGVCGIPCEATPAERFRLIVDVERVCERETKAGDPCYFLSCRDAEGMTFSVVVWESQWSRYQGRLKEGSKATLDVRVPKEGFSAFTLA